MLAEVFERELDRDGAVLAPGVRFSTCIEASGGVAVLCRSSFADLTEEPTSSRATALMWTSPRWIRVAQVAASALAPSRTRADV